MKTQTGVWIDGTKAVVVTLTNNQQHVSQVPADVDNKVHHRHEGERGSYFGNQHVNSDKKFQAKKQNQIDAFLDAVLAVIKDADELYVFGPAEIKTKLRKRIEHDDGIQDGARKLKSVLPADSMTEPQIVAHVKHFFSTLSK